MATDRSTEGMPVYPKAAPPSRVVRGEAPRFVSGSERCLPRSCKLLIHFERMAPEGGDENQHDLHRETTRPASKSWDAVEYTFLGGGGGFHTSPTFSAARESIAVISRSGSDNATTPEGGNAAESSSPERACPPMLSGGAPKETGGDPHSAEVPV